MLNRAIRKEKKLSANSGFPREKILRVSIFFLFGIVIVMLFYGTIRNLIALSQSKSAYTHILLIPFVSAYFLILKREEISNGRKYSLFPGIPLICAGIMFFILGKYLGGKIKGHDHLSVMAFSFVLFWTGGFVLFYGYRVFKVAAFPLLFLLFMIPLPSFFLDKIVTFLTKSSAEVASLIFSLTGVPMFREGAVFHIPGLIFEVAKECSGIRSSTVLLITGVLTGHLYLKTAWRKTVLCCSVIPITIFKNGLRIVTLTLLGTYVDRSILSGVLHRRGGIPFFIFALMLLSIVLALLRKSEKREFEIKNQNQNNRGEAYD